jgi:tetratricopeptide (TPR) repeat protein
VDQEVLASRTVVAGKDHPETTASLGNLATDYLFLGRFAESEEFGKRAVELTQRVLGPEHPNTLTFSYFLAMAEGFEGKQGEAEAELRRVLEMQERKLGAEHPDTLRTMGGLATLLFLRQQYGPAEDLFERTLRGQKTILAAEHPQVFATVNGLALARLAQQKFPAANSVLRENMAALEKKVPDSWQRYNAQCLTGASLAGEKKYDEAEPLLLTGYEQMKQRESTIPAIERHFLTFGKNALLHLYEAWGEPEKASQFERVAKSH